MLQRKTVKISDLGSGAHLALWGVRVCAQDKEHSNVVTACLARTFECNAKSALSTLQSFSRHLGRDGRRAITLGAPGFISASHDEVCIVSALATAQSGHVFERNAHLEWLMGGQPGACVQKATQDLADLFLMHGVTIIKPYTPPSFAIPAAPLEACASPQQNRLSPKAVQ
ncbi:MAG: hypothetical protein AAF986_01460 [Pseudomonadota bacterium]